MPKPLAEDLPYPDLSGLKKDRRNVCILAPAYADCHSETTAIFQYIFHSFSFDAKGFKEFADMLLSIAVSEMHHLDLLGEAIIRLGADPVFARRSPEKCDFYTTAFVNYSTEPAAMLTADISGETQAIQIYEQMLEKLSDPTLCALISRIILDERLHLQRLKSAYRELMNDLS